MVSKGLHNHVLIRIIFPYLEVYSHSRLVSYLSHALEKYNPILLILFPIPLKRAGEGKQVFICQIESNSILPSTWDQLPSLYTISGPLAHGGNTEHSSQ